MRRDTAVRRGEPENAVVVLRLWPILVVEYQQAVVIGSLLLVRMGCSLVGLRQGQH